LQTEVVVDAGARMVVLVDDKVVAVGMLVLAVKGREFRKGKERRVGGLWWLTESASKMGEEVGQVVSYLYEARFYGSYGGLGLLNRFGG
jgi:hypothetical protein